jgi:hypothetical protein
MCAKWGDIGIELRLNLGMGTFAFRRQGRIRPGVPRSAKTEAGRFANTPADLQTLSH